MVLFYEFKLFSSTGTYLSPAGFTIATGNINISFLAVLREACKDCKKKMASIPPSAFSSARIRETQRDMHISKIKNGKEPEKYFNTKLMELTPLKYNSKLMNSIWGFYNRYSPHNVKKINDAFSFNTELQQAAGNSSNKGDPVITLPTPTLDNVWASINVSQSH